MSDTAYSKELLKGSGDVYCHISRPADGAFVSVSWVGIQSLETVVMGSNHVLALLREQPSPALLHSTRELIGPWDTAAGWLSARWAPQARELGLQYFAHVLAHGVFGRRTFERLQPELEKQFRVRAFENETLAQAWIQFITR